MNIFWKVRLLVHSYHTNQCSVLTTYMHMSYQKNTSSAKKNCNKSQISQSANESRVYSCVDTSLPPQRLLQQSLFLSPKDFLS